MCSSDLLEPSAPEYEDALRQWAQAAQGARVHMGVAFDQGLRDILRTMAPDAGHAQVLYGARQQFFRSVMSLAAAGVEPGDLKVSEPFTRFAKDVWRRLEEERPFIRVLRDDLWRNPDSFRTGATQGDRALQARVRATVDMLFKVEPGTGRRTFIHHGFFFYTPPQ